MIKIGAASKAQHQRALELKTEIEDLRQRKLFCLYHDQSDDRSDSIEGGFGAAVRAFAKTELAKLGHVDKLSVLIDSPGGDAGEAFRLAKLFRRHTDDLEVIVVFWCKSAATLFSLCADRILMGRDGELGPLDVQLKNPKDGTMFSGLQSFKSLEYLREYVIETLHTVSTLFETRVEMDYIHAAKVARPIVSDMVTSLFRQVDPRQLGEARRLLAVGEEYAKRLMQRYAYANYDPRQIEVIVRNLVWEYPSHGFAVDYREAENLGLHVERLDDATAGKCEELLATVTSCVGMVVPAVTAATPAATVPVPAPATAAAATASGPSVAVAAPAVDDTIHGEVTTSSTPKKEEANESQIAAAAGDTEVSA